MKREVLAEDLEEILESGRKALVFSRFTDDRFGIKRLAQSLRPQLRPMLIHGEIPQRARELAIDRFQCDESVRVLLLNYAVGGVGLNLHAANYVYLFDRWWNPAVEDQAIKRAHRIGQLNKVIVRRFVCRDTIEERIVQKLADKRRLFTHVIDEARLTPAAMGLTEEEVFSLFPTLRARPKRQKKP